MSFGEEQLGLKSVGCSLRPVWTTKVFIILVEVRGGICVDDALATEDVCDEAPAMSTSKDPPSATK